VKCERGRMKYRLSPGISASQPIVRQK
jgi:hypothetical protein